MDSNENLFSVGVHFVWMSDQPVAGLGWTKSIPRDHHGKLAFKFEFPFYFVGWLAPAYGKGGANPFGITYK